MLKNSIKFLLLISSAFNLKVSKKYVYIEENDDSLPNNSDPDIDMLVSILGDVVIEYE